MDASVFLLAVAIGAVVFGVLGAWISSEKGRSGGEGFLLGGMFGPLGCLIAALLPAVAPSTPVKTNADQARVEVIQRAERVRQAKADAEDAAHWAKQNARAEAARERKLEKRQERKAATAEYYADRGIKPGPLAWFHALPDWAQATLGGVMISTPLVVGIVVWQSM